MTYKQFCKKTDITETMLIALGIIRLEQRYLNIALSADYDITPYQREFTSYYFKHHWDFADKFEYVFDLELEDSKLYPEEVLDYLAEEVGLPKFQEDGDYCKYLKQVRLHDHEELNAHGFPVNFDQFELRKLRISYIDNLKKRAVYEGSYMADAAEVELEIFPLYTFATIKAVPLVKDKFYKDLIAEAYLLYLQGNYKLAYFILYSGLESFVKTEAPKLKGQLDQIIPKLLTQKMGNLDQNTIWSEIGTLLEGADKDRNTIAHGKGYLAVNKKSAEDLISFCLVLITSCEFGQTEFKSLFGKLKPYRPE